MSRHVCIRGACVRCAHCGALAPVDADDSMSISLPTGWRTTPAAIPIPDAEYAKIAKLLCATCGPLFDGHVAGFLGAY